MPEFTILAVVAAALLFDFVNGFHDTANAIATSVLTRALSIPMAILMAAGLNFLGALVGTHVATTIGRGIVDPKAVTAEVVLAALLGAVTWNTITWYYGLPSSSSHALIGGLVGAVSAANTTILAQGGSFSYSWHYSEFNAAGLGKIGAALVISPVAGLLLGFWLMIMLMWVFRHARPARLNAWFRRLQVLSAGFMAFSHGGNDAQKTMGIITMALVSAGLLGSFEVPVWVKIACAATMALGTAVGGWRIIKTIGRNLLALAPIHGFAAETSGALVIQAATHLGLPISTTHVISSSIMGVGASRRLTAVRWKVAGQIIGAWILTLPLCMLLGAVAYWVIA